MPRMLRQRSRDNGNVASLVFMKCQPRNRCWVSDERVEEDGIWIKSEFSMMSLDEASSNPRTETSANGWQEKEGGPHYQHIYITVSVYYHYHLIQINHCTVLTNHIHNPRFR